MIVEPGFLSSSHYIAQRMKFSVKDFFSKRDQIRSFLRIWSYLLKKISMENFIFCAVLYFCISQKRLMSFLVDYKHQKKKLQKKLETNLIII